MIKQPKQTTTAQKPIKITYTDIPTYPNARSLEVEKAPKGIQMIELVSEDSWEKVLSFYQEKFAEKGWGIFASNYLKDRGTISTHPTEKETITVLAANENSLTHIRIYIQY
jgi:hypothetical protein